MFTQMVMRHLRRWASGLTRAYAAAGRRRAQTGRPAPPDRELISALEEIVEALDRRTPQAGRPGEPEIVNEAERLRASAVERMAALRAPAPPGDDAYDANRAASNRHSG